MCKLLTAVALCLLLAVTAAHAGDYDINYRLQDRQKIMISGLSEADTELARSGRKGSGTRGGTRGGTRR